MKKRKGRAVLAVIGAIAIALAVLLAVNHETVRVVFHSAWNPANELDVSGEWAGGATYRSVQYSDVSDADYLNLYVPEAEEPVPLIVVVHGGGFVSNDCESRQAQLFYQYFRDHGYACATVNYRLAQEAAFPAAVEDVKAAVRYLRANADVYGYNAEKITIWGESAGGYLAVMAGVTAQDEFNSLPFIGESELDEPVSAEISVILDFYGAMELQPKAERRAAFRALGIRIPGFAFDIADAWVTKSLEDFPEYQTVEELWLRRRLEGMSEEERQHFTPMYYVRKNLDANSNVNVLIWHGDADITVPRSQSEHLYEALCAAMGEERVQFAYIPNAGHASEKMYTDESLSKVKEYLDAVLAE